jgi:pantothenate kinase type III
MLLAIDIGNTNITIGLLRAGALIATRRAATAGRATSDELELLIEGLLRLDDATFADVGSIACASVVPAWYMMWWPPRVTSERRSSMSPQRARACSSEL